VLRHPIEPAIVEQCVFFQSTYDWKQNGRGSFPGVSGRPQVLDVMKDQRTKLGADGTDGRAQIIRFKLYQHAALG
jgi:hypothetical protein